MLNYVRSGMSGYVKITSSYFRLGHVFSGYVRFFQVISSCQVRSGLVRFGQVMQVISGYVRLYHVWSG